MIYSFNIKTININNYLSIKNEIINILSCFEKNSKTFRILVAINDLGKGLTIPSKLEFTINLKDLKEVGSFRLHTLYYFFYKFHEEGDLISKFYDEVYSRGYESDEHGGCKTQSIWDILSGDAKLKFNKMFNFQHNHFNNFSKKNKSLRHYNKWAQIMTNFLKDHENDHHIARDKAILKEVFNTQL